MELLNVVAITALLVAIAAPAYARTRRLTRKVECEENKRQLQAAKVTWALERCKTGSDVPSDSDIFGARLYLVHKLKCPTGGEYFLNAVDELPTCSDPEHHGSSALTAAATSRAKLEASSSMISYRNPDAPEPPRNSYNKVAVASAEATDKFAPNRPDGWLYGSFRLPEFGPKPAGVNQLLPEADNLSSDWSIAYDLCCYCAQTGCIREAREWFKEAMARNEAAVTRIAIHNPDLKPLWETKADR